MDQRNGWCAVTHVAEECIIDKFPDVWVSDDEGIVLQERAHRALERIQTRSVDFIYADLPFNTGRKQAAKFGSYEDSWETTDAYIEDMMKILNPAIRTAKHTATIMVHVDPRVSHYLKMMLDFALGEKNFLNEIIWNYNSGGAGKKALSRKHDTILWYAINGKYKHTFNVLREPYPHDYGDKPGFHPDGRMLTDVWTVPFIGTSSGERCGYPTQKPLALMERIIRIATDFDDIVLDPTCGSGSTLVAAKKLGRRFIGIDQNPEAVVHANERLANTHGRI